MATATYDRTPPPFFHQGPSALTKLAFFAALAVFLMVADGRFRIVQPLRAGLAVVLLPVQRTLAVPVQVWEGGSDYLGGIDRARQTSQQAEARLAAHLGVARVVDGWLEAYAEGVARRRERALTPGALHEDPAYGVGTTEYMRSVGGYAVTLECGQHEDAAGPEVARHAIRQTLALLGIAPVPLAPPAGPFECLTLAQVIDRHAEGDRFVKAWTSFDALAEGELIARRADGTEVRAPSAGYIVFPDHAAQPGSDASTGKTLHRIDEKLVRDEIERAGFKLAAQGDFLRNPADPRDRETPDPPMPKDEFVLKFVKP